jgi:hypothetical protein
MANHVRYEADALMRYSYSATIFLQRSSFGVGNNGLLAKEPWRYKTRPSRIPPLSPEIDGAQ